MSKVLKFNENIVKYKNIIKTKLPEYKAELQGCDYILGSLRAEYQKLEDFKNQILKRKKILTLQIKQLNKLKKSSKEEDFLKFVDLSLNLTEIECPKNKKKLELTNETVLGYLSNKYGQQFGSFLKDLFKQVEEE